MSHLLDRLTFFRSAGNRFPTATASPHREPRDWEDGYRKRWQHDKIVRSTHGVNCTGSCSWKIYVKGGIVTWETQQTDYPRTRPDLPNHEPRGCARGASYSWYIYSANRVKYPLIRSRLLGCGARSAKSQDAGRRLGLDPERSGQARASYTAMRGHGGFVRATWDEVNEIIAAANAYTCEAMGPGPGDRLLADPGHVDGLLCRRLALSVAAGRHLHVVLRLVLRPAAGLAHDLGRADRRARKRRLVQCRLLMLWGSNVPQTRTPDAHFYTEARYRGRQVGGRLARLFRSDQVRRHLASIPSRAPTPRWPWRWAMSSCANSISTGRRPISRTIAAAIPTCRCW
jgi:nitrate reductase alpha subunit